ncbi:DNA polymerase delta subunit 3-like [Porites lutea]|uniref:DNA polymerase delta subunit 3-like n=1 Tax=Porites lutea TaxID=51062 RepID=UPI003CC56C50
MADEEELYLANLDEFVNDEEKIVTYKWLSRTLSVPANKAKQMLYAFIQKQKSQKSSSQLTITYIVGGRCLLDGDTVQRYVITQDKDLEETKKTFSPVTSLHIYSVQKCRLKDSNTLFTVDYDIQQQHNTEDNRWSHICCSAAKRQSDGGVHRVPHGVNGVANNDKKSSASRTVNGEVESHSSRGPSTSVTEQKAKASSSKSRKGQISALEMFAAKPTASKTEKSNIKKVEDVQGDKNTEEKPQAAQTKSDSNKTGSVKSFFGQSSTVKKTSEKEAPTGKSNASEAPKKNKTDSEKQSLNDQSTNHKKREMSSDDEEEPLPPKISKAVKANTKVSENGDSKEAKKKVQKKEQEEEKTDPLKSNKARKKKAVIAESDEETEEKPRKRRKRMKELPKEGSSEDEKEEKVTNAEASKEVSPDQESTKSESPLPQQQQQQTVEKDASRPARKRKKVMKSKTFMNDEGYMVTEKVWESESTDASDDEPQIIIKPPVSYEKRPSPVKKTGAKKTHSDMKGKGVKQSSLTSFFKKS